MTPMSVELICSVLGLSPSRWPPDHYALLGLEPGEADAARIEERVLERMERLRPYQLAHPESVTDAMNRLAQALVCLTDPDARSAYDATLQPPPTPLPPARPSEEDSSPYPLAPAEPVAPAPVVLPRRVPAPARSRSDGDRRRLYRRLAAVRHLRDAWRAAGLYLADAGRRLQRPVEAVELVTALWEVRRSTDGEAAPPIGHTGQPGSLVGALARQPHLLHTFRHLLADQRAALAADWLAAAGRIDELVLELQDRVRRRRRDRLRRALRRIGRSLVTDRLDVTLFVLGLTALGIALYRSW
jgi:hypothetical protein